jgi:hypothetical protein
MTEKTTPMAAALEGEDNPAREAALKAAHDLGISDDDPVWVIVQAVRASDRALLEKAEKIERALRDTTERLRLMEERMGMTYVGYETLAANLHDGLHDFREMADERWDRCEEAFDITRKMQKWLLGLLIGSIALWALAPPIAPARRDAVPTVEEAVRRDE